MGAECFSVKMSAASPIFKVFPDKWTKDSVTEHILIHYRWAIVIFLLPISLCYDVYSAARSYIVFKMNSAPSKHGEKVKKVQKQVREWKDSGSTQPMCTARPGWQTMSI